MCLQCGRPGLNPWVGNIPWRREWLPTPIFWPGEFHGQRSLMCYSPWGCKGSDILNNFHFHAAYSNCWHDPHRETVETVSDFVFWGSKITADGDCSHEIKRLTPWKESYCRGPAPGDPGNSKLGWRQRGSGN